ncbi:tyrosine-type recombinase/integrase [Hydrogenophaga sp.]|uniref:tyrosine-type recombinase/integrase n=1 Tax=Hydrogenophaga sp. TaxID=1904254 RepID=UPI003AF93C70
MHSREQSPDRISSHIHSPHCEPERHLERGPVRDPERDSAAKRFAQLGLMAIENQWLANFASACTRRAYASDVRDFAAFSGLQTQSELLQVARSHVLAWRHHLQAQGLSPSTQRRKLAALSSLLEHLVDEQLIPTNPARGVRRPRMESHEGKTPALSLAQAQALLEAPDAHTLKGVRDRAILAVMLLGGLRRAEVVTLRVRDFDCQRAGVSHLRVLGKGGKTRFIAAAPLIRERVQHYLAMRGAAPQSDERLFVRMKAVRRHSGAGCDVNPQGRHIEEEGGFLNDRGGTGRRASTPPSIEPHTAAFERGSEGPQNLQTNASQHSLRQRQSGTALKSAGLTAGAVAQRIVQPYLAQIGVVGDRFSAHALRVTAATLALRERADLNEVRHFLGHACITTTTAYDRRWSDENQPVSLLLPLG